MQKLPDDVVEYTKLHFEKMSLLNRIAELNKQLREKNMKIINQMKKEEKLNYEIFPTLDEEKIIGGVGALQLKMKNRYDMITHDRLVHYITQFFRYVIKDEPEDEIEKLGMGLGNWIWSNRTRIPVYYLERVYSLEKPKPAQSVDHSMEPSKDKKSNKPKRRTDIPTSQQDFLAIKAFKNLIDHK